MTLRRATATCLLVTALALGSTGCFLLPVSSAPTPSSSSAAPSPTTVEETPIVEEPVELTADDIDNLLAALDTGNTAAIESYMSSEVYVIIAATECCGPMSSFDAATQLDYTGAALTPWSLTPEATIDTYRAHFYVDYFPTSAIVVWSADADPFVISFGVTGGQITDIFIASDSTLLL